MKSHVFGFALLSAIAVVASAPAHAQNGSLTRSFVSSAGVDSNACTIAAPCATFATAYTKIGANGIIAALDPGKYGAITITGPVTINGNGWAAITATAAGNGITITAGSGNVTLTGLEIDGAGAAYNGIVFNSGGNLVVKNCVLKDFVVNNSDNNRTSGNGILIAPESGTITFTFVDTIVSNSQIAGIYYLPPSGSATVTGVIDHVVASGSTVLGGIGASLTYASGGSAAISISNSVISNNTGAYGIASYAPQGSIAMTLDNDEISYNSVGVYNVGDAGSTMVLGRSTITNNVSYGIQNANTIDTFQNNQIYANGHSNVVSGNPLTPVSPQYQ
jgi:hypothetical protein